MKFFITGGSGFVGTHLSRFLLDQGHQVTITGFSRQFDHIQHQNLRYISADTTQKGAWQDEIPTMDIVINLAGRSIIQRWSETYKQKIYNSRVLTTRNVVDALPEKTDIVLCSTSAIGYYGDGGENMLTENYPNGTDFLSRVCRDWENEAFQAQKKGARVIIPRFGVVLGRNGGILGQMLPAFRMFLGGPLGNGTQWFSWIHVADLIRALNFLIENEHLEGVFNFCSPNSVRNRDLTRILGEILNRPTKMAVPGFMLRLAMGELGEFLLASQKGYPQKLLENEFEFQYTDFKTAALEVIRNG